MSKFYKCINKTQIKLTLNTSKKTHILVLIIIKRLIINYSNLMKESKFKSNDNVKVVVRVRPAL